MNIVYHIIMCEYYVAITVTTEYHVAKWQFSAQKMQRQSYQARILNVSTLCDNEFNVMNVYMITMLALFQGKSSSIASLTATNLHMNQQSLECQPT